MVKKTMSKLLIAGAMAAALMLPASAYAQTASPMFDYSKVMTIQHDGMELVPLRAAAEMLGYRVMWSGKDQSVTLIYEGGMESKMSASSNEMNSSMGTSTGDMSNSAGTSASGMNKSMDKSAGSMNTGMDNQSGSMKKATGSMNTESGMTSAGTGMIDKGYTVKIGIGQKSYTVNGKPMMLMYAPMLLKNHTYVTKSLIDNDLVKMGGMGM